MAEGHLDFRRMTGRRRAAAPFDTAAFLGLTRPEQLTIVTRELNRAIDQVDRARSTTKGARGAAPLLRASGAANEASRLLDLMAGRG